MRLSLQVTSAPGAGWVQVCESTTDEPATRVVGAVVTVPVILSLISPSSVALVGTIVLFVIVVNVTTKSPPSVEGMVTTQVPVVVTGPTPTLTLVGTKATSESLAIFKFPVDGALNPGLTIVFAVVPATMSPAGVRVAMPPSPG
jgi:hypothetical protein